MKISFIGDISLNDNYIELYKKGINPFIEVEPYLQNSDCVVGNLECIAKGDNGENILKKPRLTTTIETLNYLKNINIKVACLAQNHVYDHLGDGFRKTIDFLDQNKILHIGAGLLTPEAEKYQIIQKDGVSIALINYVTYDTNPNLPADAEVYLNMFDKAQCIKDIQGIRTKVNHIVLSLHWGGRVEGGLFPDWDQPSIAHKLIDAGADLIIGHHSHTIQPYEVYKGKYIFYSLGNFCFSDYWFNGEFYPIPKRQMVSLIVGVSFAKYKYSVDTFYYLNEVESYSLYDGYHRNITLRNKLFKIVNRNKLAWLIYYFHKQWILPLFLFSTEKTFPFVLNYFDYLNTFASDFINCSRL